MRFLQEDDELWELWLRAGQLSAMVRQCISTEEPAHAGKYAFHLAQMFNNFYHKHHILSEADEAKKLMASAQQAKTGLPGRPGLVGSVS